MKPGRSKHMIKLAVKTNKDAQNTNFAHEEHIDDEDCIPGTPGCQSPLPPGARTVIEDMQEIYDDVFSDDIHGNSKITTSTADEENMNPNIQSPAAAACLLREDPFMTEASNASPNILPSGCEPVSIWGLVRHGQRNPGTEFGKYMRAALVIRDHVVSSYKRGNSSLCAQDVQNLEDWKLNADMFDKPFQLTKEGYTESKDIGRRLKEAFPKLLQNLEKNDYQFRPAPGAWMADSAKAFVEGLSDRGLTIEPPRTDYDVLSPYDTCNKYINIKKDPKTYAEPANYMSSSDFLASMDRIQRRLGIGYTLTETNATALWDLCRYTSSGLTGTLSPWCALFTTEDLKVMEYIADLRHYYKSGYGTSINELFGQITLTDLLKSFQDAKSGKGKKITTYVSHATMMDMVYTALKLFKDDEPLTGSLRKPDRKWRSSKQAVFSANLMVVLNKCNQDDYNVVFYLNEEPLQSICKDGVCTWKEFEDMLTPFLNTNTDFCD